MSVIHTVAAVATEAVDGKALHPHLRSTRIARRSWGSTDSSTIHSTYYHY
jgi:hypothetical protein